MSYCRWSTDIRKVMTMEEEMELYKRGFNYYEVKTIKENRGAEFSMWYVFDHVNGLCSVWCAGEEPINYVYEDLERMIETQRYDLIDGYNKVSYAQQLFLQDVLDDVIEVWREEQNESITD